MTHSLNNDDGSGNFLKKTAKWSKAIFSFNSVPVSKMVFGILREQDNLPPPPPAGQCFVMAFPIKYGLPPMCVEGQTPDSPAHVKVCLNDVAFEFVKLIYIFTRLFSTTSRKLRVLVISNHHFDFSFLTPHQFIPVWSCLWNQVIDFFLVCLISCFSEERKMFQFEANGASALAARWHNRVYGR
jgi:hypothetical protein